MKEVFQKTYIVLLSILLFSLVGCATTFNISPTFTEFEEPPITEKIDATVGISVPEQVRSYIYSDDLIKVAFGKSGASRFAEVASWLFSEPIEISEKKTWNEIKIPLDGFLELESLSLERKYWRGEDSSPEIDYVLEIRVEYKICFYDTNGEEINCWITNQSVLHKGFESLSVESELMPSIERAVRGTMAKFIVSFKEDSEVKEWASAFSEQSSDKGHNLPLSFDPKAGKRAGLYLLWHEMEVTAPPLEEKYEKYIIKGMLQKCPTDNIVRSQDIRDILYPFMEPETAPKTEDALIKLIYQEDIRKRMINNGILYLAVVYGHTDQGDKRGYILCGYGAAPAAGCVGFAWADEETNLIVLIFDLLKFKMDERFELDAEDKHWAIGLGLPFWHYAQSEKKGCMELGVEIGRYLMEYENSICRE